MNFYEQQLRRIFGSSTVLPSDTLFKGNCVLAKIDDQLRVKIAFTTTGISEHYTALKLQIINTTNGCIDSELFRFSNYIKSTNGEEPCVVGYLNPPAWFNATPRQGDYQNLQNDIENYVTMYANEEFISDHGPTMDSM